MKRRHDAELLRELSEGTGLSVRSIRRGLDSLIECGHLHIEERRDTEGRPLFLYVADIKENPASE